MFYPFLYSFITKGGLNSCPKEKEGVTFSQVDFSEEVMLKIISFKIERSEEEKHFRG